MTAAELIERLDYRDSPNFLRSEPTDGFRNIADFGHIFRRAQKHCKLQGVYSLVHPESSGHDSVVPVVYVCEAADESEAQKWHRLVWNQDVVPFLIVVSPKTVRLYPGFQFPEDKDAADPLRTGILRAAESLDEAMTFLDAFRAEKIDNGSLWQEWGHAVRPETRVDWRLLESLNRLDVWLQTNHLELEHSHSLIGKFVYLQYLRQRNILSDRKLSKWGVDPKSIFSRNATLKAFWTVVDQLDDWLNGSTFPLDNRCRRDIKQEHLRKLAGTFAGDDPDSGQRAFDFGIYDFSFIPIETLSVIYEQFLHSPRQGQAPRGRTEGAYYTPIPLVNFMLEELDTLHPFQPGMRVLDPACGSGAFLVQCYRRIIERDHEFVPGQPMRPARLRELLEEHVFGIDRDGDACRVTELSLCLTLLDYVDPPDLERTPRFLLPDLRTNNIFEGDFFDSKAGWRETIGETRFDWIVGNPPWIEPKGIDNTHVRAWMEDRDNKKHCPVGGNQVAEAFAWQVEKHLADDGFVSLLLPAMTLFKDESQEFRKRFFKVFDVRCVANFANLAYVLFSGHRVKVDGKTKKVKAERPATAFFYSRSSDNSNNRDILVFSPLVAEQPATRPHGKQKRSETWNIVVDSSQIRTIGRDQAASGKLLPWKAAMWGSHLDERFLDSFTHRFPSFDNFCQNVKLVVSQGIELRKGPAAEVEHVPELTGKPRLATDQLPSVPFFAFPQGAFEPIPPELSFVRRGRVQLPLSICRPPHIVVDKLRRFAIYSEEFIAVPPRQIGIAGTDSQKELLKALSLYFISDFVRYHQFLLSPEWGVSTSISTLDTLRALPIPLGNLNQKDLAEWVELYSKLADTGAVDGNAALFSEEQKTRRESTDSLLAELNARVNDVLGLQEDEQALIADLLNVRLRLIKGKVDDLALRPPTRQELLRYGEWLQRELNAFVEDQESLHHNVAILPATSAIAVAIDLLDGDGAREPARIIDTDAEAEELLGPIRKRIRTKHSQWVYFDRELRVPHGATTYVFKPAQLLNWTASQALLDAGTIIAETLR